MLWRTGADEPRIEARRSFVPYVHGLLMMAVARLGRRRPAIGAIAAAPITALDDRGPGGRYPAWSREGRVDVAR